MKNSNGFLRIKDLTAAVAHLGTITFFYCLVIILQALMYGENMIQDTFGSLPSIPDRPAWYEWLYYALCNVWAAMEFMWKLVTFDIPEMPILLRPLFLLPLGIVVVGVVVTIIRGGGGGGN